MPSIVCGFTCVALVIVDITEPLDNDRSRFATTTAGTDCAGAGSVATPVDAIGTGAVAALGTGASGCSSLKRPFFFFTT